jgi:hypothetical protein
MISIITNIIQTLSSSSTTTSTKASSSSSSLSEKIQYFKNNIDNDNDNSDSWYLLGCLYANHHYVKCSEYCFNNANTNTNTNSNDNSISNDICSLMLYSRRTRLHKKK